MSTTRLKKNLDKKNKSRKTTKHVDPTGEIIVEHRQAPKKKSHDEMLEAIEKEINNFAIGKITTEAEQKKLLEDFNRLKDFCRHPNKNSHVIDITKTSLETTLAKIRVRLKVEKIGEDMVKEIGKNQESLESLVEKTDKLQKEKTIFKPYTPKPSAFSRFVTCFFPCCASKEEEGTKAEKAPLLGLRK